MDLQLHNAKDKVAVSDDIFARDFNEGLARQQGMTLQPDAPDLH